MTHTPSRRSRKVPRKADDSYAVLAVAPEKLEERILKQYGSLRHFANLAGHSSHTYIWRIAKGEVRTTSTRTADVMEGLLNAQGLLFARMLVKSDDRSAA
jgi:hypothetical protein